MNYHHLHYFWAVAHSGSLTQAAQQLHVAQSAVSRQIAQLERQLGHALFHREGRRLSLTEAGRIALDHADAIFRLGQDLVGTLSHSHDGPQVLRVGSMATLSRNFLMGFLSPLRGRSDLDLVVRSGTQGELLRDLEAHRLDVVLTNGHPATDAQTAWVAHRIDEQPVSLIGPRKRRRKLALAELIASEPLVLPSTETGIRAGFDALVQRLGVAPRIAAEVDDMAMLRLLARDHDGLAVLPPIVVKDELDSRRLVEVAPIPGLTEIFSAITLRRRFPNPLLAELLAA